MNPIIANILIALCAVAFGYLCGSIPNGVIIGKLFFHKDPREFGSHNSGGTNVGRAFGAKAGVATILLDMVKIALPLYVTWAILVYSPLKDYMGFEGAAFGSWYAFDNFGQGAAPLYYWLAALAGLIGHVRSIFLGFKGGKAVASFLGFNMLAGWAFLLAGVTSFGGTFAKSRMVSLSSIIASLTFTAISWLIAGISYGLTWYPGVLTWCFLSPVAPLFGFELAFMNTIGCAIVIIRHRENIARIKEGTESRNPWGSGNKQ